MTDVQDKPIVLCRCCGVEMDAKWQQPITKSREGFFYLTCWQSECKLEGYTFTSNDYERTDLSLYLKSSN